MSFSFKPSDEEESRFSLFMEKSIKTFSEKGREVFLQERMYGNGVAPQVCMLGVVMQPVSCSIPILGPYNLHTAYASMRSLP